MCAFAIALGVIATAVAKILLLGIALFTNLFFFQKFSLNEASLLNIQPGHWSILVPVLGGLIVGVMARFGSAAIRGHGIPEAMEKILSNESRVPGKLIILKPLSAAIAIGSGGPFGAEGPIIATGGALGSLLGQYVHVSASERKTLLACGAAAGMTAIFGTPLAGVLLAIELLLFEFRSFSFIPVAMSAAVAATLHFIFFGKEPFFPMANFEVTGVGELGFYLASGVFFGILAVVATKAVYLLEEAFEKIPIHWMWWPALGGLGVGLIGYIEPRSLGVGYGNIGNALAVNFSISAAVSLLVWKFLSWAIALSSGTSGGTLAPLLTIGSLSGCALGLGANALFPQLGINVHVVALVGMAATFAGASRSLLASVVFALEATRQPLGIVPLLGACSISYLLSHSLMRHSIMTEKISRRGVRVPHEYFPEAENTA